MADTFQRALIKEHNVLIGIAITTDTCRTAQSSQMLAPGSAVALSRLLTSAALIGLVQNNRGSTSLQVVTQGPLGQAYADVNHEGHLRGYVKNTLLPMPPTASTEDERWDISHYLGEGELSVIQIAENNQFTQSKTPLSHSEIDRDVATYTEQSAQIPTELICAITFGDDEETIGCAAGLLVQSMPGTDQAKLEEVRSLVSGGGFARLVEKHRNNWQEILGALVPEATLIGDPRPLRWKCRCSYERVVNALKMLGPIDLADMIQKQEKPEVSCDFCQKQYVIETSDVERVYSDSIIANN